ncbi:MAG: hypothetical protein JWQ24_4785 [Tardiphaga sp.]|nr:hypothetical protein [Tardiphaga sp.]
MSAYWIVCRDCGNGKGYEFSFKTVEISVWKRFSCGPCNDAGGEGKRIQVLESLFDGAECLTREDLAASKLAIVF